jgi:hypothetical protein
MARVTDGILPDDFIPALTIDRYQEIMRLPIAAFNGLNNPNEETQYECSTIWKQSDRDYIAEHLAQAEDRRERELGYFLAPKYVEADYEYDDPLELTDRYLIRVGTQTITDIEDAVALTLGVETSPNDPVTVVVATTVTDPKEIIITYPGEDVEIKPKSVSISGGNATILIPRSRLVLPSLNDDRSDHLSYYENDNFLTTVDVKRKFYDETSPIQYVWLGYQYSGQSTVEVTQTAWNRVREARLSVIEHWPAILSSGVWTRRRYTKPVRPALIRIHYLSGRTMSMYTEITTARFAHTLMPNKPVSCPTVHQYWQEDIMEHSAGIMTPYGDRAGAVNAWVSDSREKVGVGGKFPRTRRVMGCGVCW